MFLSWVKDGMLVISHGWGNFTELKAGDKDQVFTEDHRTYQNVATVRGTQALSGIYL